MIAVAVAPTALSQASYAARETTCTNIGGQEKSCTSSAANCQTTKAGQGQGGGETKSSGCSTP